MLHSPGRVLLDLGDLFGWGVSLPVRYYGLCIGVAFLVVLWGLVSLLSKHFSQSNRNLLYDWAIWTFVGGVLGARLWFVLLNFEYYFLEHPLEIFAIWEGGQSIQGGFVGGVLFSYVYYVRNKLSMPISWLYAADVTAIMLPIGQAIGRLGNFFNTEGFGLPTSMPWGLYVPYAERPAGYLSEQSFHPVFFYEGILLLVVSLVLFYLWAYYKRLSVGVLFCAYLIAYSVIRFFLESIRLDSLYIGIFPAAQVICIITVIICLVAVRGLSSKSKQNASN